MMRSVLLLLLVAMLPLCATAQHHQHDAMRVSPTGIVMNENTATLPRGCEAVSGDHNFTVHAGRQYSNAEPGVIFGMSPNAIQVEPCSRVTVTFVNDDEVRHQWMVHGLPRYLYPGGMFHIEAMGGQRQTGTFIVPADDRSYLIHCDMAQHMEKGMRGQLTVGRGSGSLWGVVGLSDAFVRANYLPGWSTPALVLTLLFAFVIVLFWSTRRNHG